MSETIVSLENISFSYGSRTILDDVGIAINEGDFMGIVGPNGSGKSTLMKISLGLIKPQQGKIQVFNQDIGRFKDWGKIGYVSQRATSFNQGFPATVEEVVTANLYPRIGLTGRMDKGMKEKVYEALDTVGMLEYRSRLIGKLSGGQQQRVFIAKALVSEPKIIMMDEPTVGIDSRSEESFYLLMDKLNKDRNITVVMVTHDIGAISKRVNRILCLSEGKIFEHDCGLSGEEINSSIYNTGEKKTIMHSH